MKELAVDNFYGHYDLILQPSAFLDAHTFIGNTAVMQIDKIRELIGGKIYVTPARAGKKKAPLRKGLMKIVSMLNQERTIEISGCKSIQNYATC